MSKNAIKTEKIKRIYSNQKAITLIALVITIVVLLILAGISIVTLTGENGILTQASNAKEQTRGANVAEIVNLWKVNNKSDKLAGSSTVNSRTELLNDLRTQELITPDEYTILENGGTITIGSKKIRVVKTLVEAFYDGDIKVGDYVNYTPIQETTISVEKSETGYDATQTYTVDMDTTWRVLGLSEDGTSLLLISGSPIRKDGENPYLIFQGAESYFECEDTLDKICNIYKNDYATEVRSIKIEDINRALGLIVDKENNKVYKTSNPNKTEQLLKFNETFTYKAGDYAPENYMKETYLDNQKYQQLANKEVGDTVEGTMYMYSYTNSSIVEQDGKLYEMLFKDSSKAKSYWLANSGIFISGNAVGVGPGAVEKGSVMSGSCLGYNEGGYPCFIMVSKSAVAVAEERGIRPIVILEPNVTEVEIEVIANKTEEEWNSSPGTNLRLLCNSRGTNNRSK